MVRQDEVSFDEDRVAGQESRRPNHTTQPEELSSGHGFILYILTSRLRCDLLDVASGQLVRRLILSHPQHRESIL